MGMVAECPIIEFSKLTDATLDAGADGGRPENTLLSELQAAVAPLSQEALDFFIRGAGKEKDFVKVASFLTESERKVTRGTPVSWESVCRASAAAGRASATGMQVKRPSRNVAAFLVREASNAGRRWK